MNIAIQASDLDHARIDGTRVYVKELLRRFGPLSSETDFSLYHRGIFNPSLAPPKLANYHEHSLPFPYAWMQTRFAWEMFRTHPDRLFLPIQAAPVWLPSSLEVTATIHDLAFRRFPETFPVSHLRKLNFMLDTVVRQADKLIAVSESTKRDLLEFFPALAPEKIRVIHHGFDAEFFGTRLSVEDLASNLKPYNLQPTSYVLYVGALQPRKNLVRLIGAFEKVKEKLEGSLTLRQAQDALTTRQSMKLVLAGEPAWLSDGILEAARKSRSASDIVLTGRVSFESLRALYQGARIFAFPSLYEGFGLPLLEAFASGVPVLTADNSSLMEVAADAALYASATDVDALAEKLELLWKDEALRTDLISKGQARLKQFSWDKTASETLRYIKS